MCYQYWKNHFEANRFHFDDIDWNMQDGLLESEKKLITGSLQQFQKGEHSEGKHLFAFAKTMGNMVYTDSIKLFICEEQKHAIVLGRFMERENIARISKHWLDNIFRWLRKLAGLENTLIVLLTAEIISKIFYKALASATMSELLKKICKQVLDDEDQHIAFQCYTLSILYSRKGRIRKFLSRAWNQVLMVGTIFIVWTQHYRVLKAGGYSFTSFMLETLLVFVEADKQIKQPVKLQMA